MSLRRNISGSAILTLGILVYFTLRNLELPQHLRISSPVNILQNPSDWTTTTPSSNNCIQYPHIGNIALIVRLDNGQRGENLTQHFDALQCFGDSILYLQSEHDPGRRKSGKRQQAWRMTVMEDAKRRSNAANVTQQAGDVSSGGHDTSKLSRNLGSREGVVVNHFAQTSEAREIEFAWETLPHQDWYLFIDAHTYVNWSNVMQWLATLNSEESIYFRGPRQTYGSKERLLSGSAVKLLASPEHDFQIPRPDTARGEHSFTLALEEKISMLDIKLKEANSSFGGPDWTSLPLSPETWCQPIITLTNMNSSEAVHPQSNQAANPQRIFRFKDLYQSELFRDLPRLKEHWHNFADTPGELLRSFPSHGDGCETVCKTEDDCMQWMVTEVMRTDGSSDSTCFLSGDFRLGRSMMPLFSVTRQTSWTSGWIMSRVEEILGNISSCEEGDIAWPS